MNQASQIIPILLWIPFGIVMLISGIIFCVSGYRRGLLSGLASLGATLVASLCGILLAKLVSGLVSPALAGIFVARLVGSAASSFSLLILRTMISAIAMLALYFIFMFLFTILFKFIANTLWGESLRRSGAGMRWGGVAVRLVDAVLYSLLLLLPLYGSLATYVPPVTSVMEMAATEDPDARQVCAVLDSMASHPISRTSGSGPMGMVYDQLANIPVEEGNLNLAEMARTAGASFGYYNTLMMAGQDGSLSASELDEFYVFFRQNVMDQPWFYTMYRQLLTQIEPMLMEEERWGQQLFALMDMNQTDFWYNCDAICEVLEYAMESGAVLRLVEDPDSVYDVLYSTGLMEQLGKMINASDQSTGLRDFLVELAVRKITGDDPVLTRRLLAAYHPSRYTDGESRIRDAEAMLRLQGVGSSLDLLESLMRLPNFDRDVLRQIFYEMGARELLELSYYDSQMYQQMLEAFSAQYGEDFSMEDYLWSYLENAGRQPLKDATASDWVWTQISVATLGEYGQWGGYRMDGQTLSAALEEFGQESFARREKAGRLASGKVLFDFAGAAVDYMNRDIPRGEAGRYVYGYEFSQLANLINVCMDPDNSKLLGWNSLEELLREFVNRDGRAVDMALWILQNKGYDPFGISQQISGSEKKMILDALENVKWGAWYDQGEVEINARVQILLQLLGIAE